MFYLQQMNRTIYNIFAFARVRDICFLKIFAKSSLAYIYCGCS